MASRPPLAIPPGMTFRERALMASQSLVDPQGGVPDSFWTGIGVAAYIVVGSVSGARVCSAN